MIVELNGRQIDISGVFPLKIRDWKALEADGVSVGNERAPITESAEIVFYVLHRVDPSVTREEIDEMPLNHPAYQAVLRAMRESGEPADDPFSRPSTFSVEPTAGPNPT